MPRAKSYHIPKPYGCHNIWRRAYIIAIIMPYKCLHPRHTASLLRLDVLLSNLSSDTSPLAYALMLFGSPVCKKLHMSLNITSAT